MSINAARDAFRKGLGSAGQVQSCTMNYATVDNNRLQRFTVRYVKGGVSQTIEIDVAPMGDIVAALSAAGQTAAGG